MALTFAEKVLSAKAGHEVRAGEIVTVEPDVVLSHDNSAAIARHFATIGVKRVRYPERIVIVLDHCVPAADFKHATNHKQIREFVCQQDITGFFDISRGVCHQVLLEQGYAHPGTLAVGSDSHTTSYGAVGAFAAGIGRTEAACTWATGELWLRVPETLRLAAGGEWPWRVGAKDLMLHVAGQIGADGADYMSVEWTGEAVHALSVDSRIVLCNMSAEIGAKNGYVPPDEKVKVWLEAVGAKPRFAQATSSADVPSASHDKGSGKREEGRGERDEEENVGGLRTSDSGPAHGNAAVHSGSNKSRQDASAPTGAARLRPYEQWHSDADAQIARTVDVDISALAPQIARPHRVDNVVPIGEVKGTRVHQCLLGTCTNGRYEDLMEAWDVLDGNSVSPRTRLLVFPASQAVNHHAAQSGLIERFISAGAVWMNPGCGPCLGAHEGALAPGEACLSTANRNFKGRMGTPESEIYLASPASVAAAAISGEITDPREV